MKKIFLSFIFAVLVFGCKNVETKQVPHALQSVIDTIQKQFVPDRRVNVYEIKAKDVDGKTILKGATTLANAKTELLKLAREKNKNIVDSIVVLPDSSLGDKTYGVVTLSVASMRTSGKYSAEMATQGLLGMPVKILQGGGWLRVQTPDGYIAYTVSGNVKRMNKAQFNEWIAAPKIIIVENYATAYAAPNASNVVSDLVLGNMLKLEAESGAYYKVSFPDGRMAYVQKSQAKKINEWQKSIKLTGDEIAEYGRRFMGLAYLWGANSPKGMDCSGFAKTVYFMHGVIIPRDASQQCYSGQNIDIDDDFKKLQTGDLLFFGTNKARPRHVGIYIGNKQFIHEATQVKIGSLDPAASNYDEGNATELTRATRIIGNTNGNGVSTFETNEFYQNQN